MAKSKKTEEVVVEERKFANPSINDFDVIIAPIVTEKTMKLQQEQNKITCKVKKTANKIEIKNAFETIFNVKVEEVKVINVLAKAKRAGGHEGYVSGYKKAIIKLSADEKINLYNE